jgi:hypothetical protein
MGGYGVHRIALRVSSSTRRSLRLCLVRRGVMLMLKHREPSAFAPLSYGAFEPLGIVFQTILESKLRLFAELVALA